MSSPPGRTPISQKAEEHLLPVLAELSKAIILEDDETAENKLRFSVEYLQDAAARMQINLAPIAPPNFRPSSTKAAILEPFPDLPVTLSPDHNSRILRSTLRATQSATSANTFLPILASNALARTIANLPEIHPDGTPPASHFQKNRSITNKVQAGTLIPAQMALMAEVSTTHMQNFRRLFSEHLSKQVVTVKKHFKPIPAEFKPDEVTLITKVLFEQIFNVAGFRRACKIAASARTATKLEIPVTSTILAQKHSMNASLPTEIREFCASYVITAPKATRSAVETFRALHASYLLYDQWLTLIETPTKKLQTELESRGFSTGRGVCWKDVIYEYCSTMLGLQKGELSPILAKHRVPHLLASSFGIGILAMVDEQLPGSLRSISIQKLERAVTVLRDIGVLPYFHTLCRRVYQNIVQPVLQGTAPGKFLHEQSYARDTAMFDLLGYVDYDMMEVEVPEPRQFKDVVEEKSPPEGQGSAETDESSEEESDENESKEVETHREEDRSERLGDESEEAESKEVETHREEDRSERLRDESEEAESGEDGSDMVAVVVKKRSFIPVEEVDDESLFNSFKDDK